MIVFKDMTFCSDECLTTACPRHNKHTVDNIHNLPIAYASFKDGCMRYVAPKRWYDNEKEEAEE